MAKGFGSGAYLLKYWKRAISHLLCQTTQSALNCGLLYDCMNIFAESDMKWQRLPTCAGQRLACAITPFRLSGELIFHWGVIESPGAGWSNPPAEAQDASGMLVKSSAVSPFLHVSPWNMSQASHQRTCMTIQPGAEQQLAHKDQDLSWSQSDNFQSEGSRRAIRRKKQSNQWTAFFLVILLYIYII